MFKKTKFIYKIKTLISDMTTISIDNGLATLSHGVDDLINPLLGYRLPFFGECDTQVREVGRRDLAGSQPSLQLIPNVLNWIEVR